MLKSLLPLALALLLTGTVHAASRYAGEFLGLGAGARSAALGSAYVALADDATAGYWNAAGLSALSGRQVHLTHSEHFSGLIQRDFCRRRPTGSSFARHGPERGAHGH